MTRFWLEHDVKLTGSAVTTDARRRILRVVKVGMMRSVRNNGLVEKPYVVIVEDDQALAQLLCEVFEDAGNRCFAIRSKTSAEHFLRQVRPDLLVVDYQLIGGIGLEAAHIASEGNVPVIVISGHLNVSDRVREAGYFWLRKPFTSAEMLNLASMALGADLTLPGHPPIQLH